MTVKFTNNASTTVGTGINTSATSLTVASASSFPSLSGADDYCYLTIQQSTGTVREVVKATALSGNTFTIVRAQDNTSAGTWSAGDIVELRMTAALLTDVIDAATVEGVKTNFQYTPTSGQTVFSGADDDSNTLIINQAALVSVYMNGVRLVQGTDYSVSSANNTVTLTAGATTADIIDIEVFGNFTGQSGAAVAITGGAISGTSVAATTLSASGTATLNTFVSNNITVSGGSLDGVTIGGTTRGAISGNAISGTSFASTGNMTFGDNDKAIFGAGSDLQIYHDGSNSYISEQGTGSLVLQGSNLTIEATDGTNYIAADDGVSVYIYHPDATNQVKLSTTSTGIDVTGTVTTDGMTSAGDVAITGGSSGSTVATFTSNAVADTPLLVFQRSGGAVAGKIGYDDTNTAITFGTTTNHEIRFLTNNAERMQLDASGNLTGATSFETAAGGTFTTASGNDLNIVYPDGRSLFFKEAGTTTLSLDNAQGATFSGDVSIDKATPQLIFKESASAKLFIGESSVVGGGGAGFYDFYAVTGLGQRFFTNSLERMRIDAANGNVGIGATPIAPLHVKGTTNGNLLVRAGSLAVNTLTGTALSSINDAASATVPLTFEGSEFNFVQSNAVKVKVDSSGNVGIGVTPARRLHVSTSGVIPLRLTSTGTDCQIELGNSGGTPIIGSFNDQLIFNTASTERLRIDSSGQVLIGTSTVAYAGTQLNIGDTSDSESGVQIQSAVGGVGYVLFGDGASAAAYRGQVNYSHASDHMAFNTAGAEAMRIDSSGNLGIGVSNPSDYYAKDLVVTGPAEGGITIASTGNHTNYLLFADSTSGVARYAGMIGYAHDTDTMSFRTNSVQRMAINSDGKVDVGGVANQTTAVLNARFNGGAIEFGHGNNSSGYYGTAGSYGNNGQPYIGFSCYSQENLNLFTTNGFKGNIITADLSGNLTFAQITTASGTNLTPVNRMTLDASGNLGIGVADGDVTSDGTASRTYVGIIGSGNRGRLNLGSTASNGADSGVVSFVNGANELGALYMDTTPGVQNTGTMYINSTRSIKIQAAATDEVVFNENGVDVDFRVESDGDAYAIFVDASVDAVVMGNNTQRTTGGFDPKLTVEAGGGTTNACFFRNNLGNAVAGFQVGAITGAANFAIFYNGNGSAIGSIQTSNATAGTSVSFNTSSDYRLKENVVAMSGATERLKQLKPSRFNFIADADTTVDGFLAHEVQEIVPEAITGAKDAVDADGNPEYQGIDQSKLVPLLVATIQELEARIAALES
jgi:hypothetical protein